MDVNGVNPDFSKKAAMEEFFALPRRVPDARFELAIWLNADDREATPIEQGGWQRPRPEIIARTPKRYYKTSSLAGRIYSRETRPIHAIGVAE